jgi:hypothetical protein
LLAQTTDVRALEALRREINYEGKIMFSKFATAAVAATLSLAASAAMAGAGDYSFDPVNPEMKKGDDMADNASPQVPELLHVAGSRDAETPANAPRWFAHAKPPWQDQEEARPISPSDRRALEECRDGNRWRRRAEPDDGRQHRQQTTAAISVVGASSDRLRLSSILKRPRSGIAPPRPKILDKSAPRGPPIILFASRLEEQCVRSR